MKRFKMKVYLVFTLILGVLILQGCGGSGGGGDWDDPAITSITVTPVTAAIPVGATQQFTAMATYANGTTKNVTEDAGTVWTTVNLPAGVATLSTNGVVGAGLATGVLIGTAEITATFGGLSDTATLTVNAATLLSVTVTPLTPSVTVGDTQQFTAMATYNFGPDVDVTENAGTVWTTLPAGVATLSMSGVAGAGLATGVVAGTADITATFGGLSDSTTLTVNDATLLSVTVTPVTASVPVGVSQQFIAMATYNFGPDVDVTENAGTVWTTLPAGVATLSTSGVAGAGLATGAIVGTGDITATFGGQSDTAILTVNDATLQSITVTPATATIAVGDTQQYLAMATYSFGPDVDVTENAGTEWTTANNPAGVPATLVASMSPNGVVGAGLATGLVDGTSDITATYNLMTDTATLIVDEVVIPGAVCSVDSGPTIPTVTESNPTNGNLLATTSTAGVANDGKLITANFSMAMDPLTIESALPGDLNTFTIKETVSGINVDGTVAMDPTNTIATFTTSAALVADRAYTASITIAAESAGGVAIACPYEWNFTTATPAATGLAPVNMTGIESFGVLGGQSITLGGGPASTTGYRVEGDVGISPGSTCNGCDNTTVSGVISIADTVAADAKVALVAAYDDAIGRTVDKCTLVTDDLTTGPTAACGLGSVGTFYPGLYWSGTSIAIPVGGTITLDALGDPNAVFIFQSESTIITNADSHVILAGMANANNVFWVGKTSATIGGTGADFTGTVLVLADFTVNGDTQMLGRALARNGDVTVQDLALITVPTP